MSSIDELAVRAALADLVQEQPDMPVDRVDGVRRRHVRRRRAQAAGAAACAVLAVVGVGVGVGLPRGGRAVAPTHRDVPSWALPWPEHRDPSIAQSVLDGALQAWSRSTYGENAPAMFAPRHVVWYVAAAGVQSGQVAVVFEVERDDGDHRLVAGVLDDAADPQTPDNWALHDVPAPNPHTRNLAVSFYLQGPSTDVPNNAFLVLTDPKFRDVSPSVPGRLPLLARLDKGFAILPFGPLRTQLHLALSTAKGPAVPVGVVGLPGAPDSQVPALELPAELVGVPQGNVLSEAGASGNEISMNETVAGVHGRTGIYARCYGGPSISVIIDSQERKAVTIPCDDRQHVVGGPAVVPGGNKSYAADTGGPSHTTEVMAGNLVAWRVAVVVR